MEKLIGVYEMVSLNNALLRDSERTAIRKAGRALRMFERAMKGFNTIPKGVRTLQKTAFEWPHKPAPMPSECIGHLRWHMTPARS